MNSSLLKSVGIFLIVVVIVVLLSFTALKGSANELKKEDVEKIVGQYIKDHPKDILDSVMAFQKGANEEDEKKAQAKIGEKLKDIENDPTSPVAGNPNGDVTIVEFFDYSCGYCKKVFPAIVKLLDEDKGLRLVLKEFPILGPNSDLASRAALAVNKIAPQKYFAFHKKLMAVPRITGQDSIDNVAKEEGIDVAKMKEAMKDEKINDIINKDKQLAGTIGVRGTPAFIVGGQFVPGAIDYDSFKTLISETRSKKGK